MIEIRRGTGETDVTVRLGLVAEDRDAEIRTDSTFLDHMLHTLARYAGIRLDVAATGDMEHHLVEDVAITLGLAFADAVPATCRRYGHATVPMDDALVGASLDVGGRHFWEGPLPDELWDHFCRSLAENAGWTLHVRVHRGRDTHHVIEAAIKALGLALRQALQETGAVFSTKGAVRLDRRELDGDDEPRRATGNEADAP